MPMSVEHGHRPALAPLQQRGVTYRPADEVDFVVVGSGAARESFSRSSMSRLRAIRSFKSAPAALGFAAGLGQLARFEVLGQLFIG